MTRGTTFVRALTSASLVLVCLAASARGQTPDGSAAASAAANEKGVMVTLQYDPKAPTVAIGVAMPSPDPVELSKGKGHKAHWYLSPPEIGSMKIEMKNADPKPFKANPKNNGKDSLSEAPARGDVGQTYAYKITVHVDSLNKDFVLDPIIKITP